MLFIQELYRKGLSLDDTVFANMYEGDRSVSRDHRSLFRLESLALQQRLINRVTPFQGKGTLPRLHSSNLNPRWDVDKRRCNVR